MAQILLIGNKAEAERGLGNAKLIPSPTANVFLGGGLLPGEKDILLQRGGSPVMAPGDQKWQQLLLFSIWGTIIGVTALTLSGQQFCALQLLICCAI